MVPDYCIAKCQMFSACGRLLMAIQAILIVIQNIFELIATLQEYGKLKKKKNSLTSVFKGFCS